MWTSTKGVFSNDRSSTQNVMLIDSVHVSVDEFTVAGVNFVKQSCPGERYEGKARSCFFECLQGDLSSLSAWLEVCVVPVLMQDLENWILNTLESFLTEMGKRILKLPKWGSNRDTPATKYESP